MNLIKAITEIESNIENPRIGLPDEIFKLTSRLTPLVNVDLLIKDKNNRILLAWRDDRYVGAGWHIPGGIVRYKESLENRIHKVAETEIGAPIIFKPAPITMNQVISNRNETRGHFISFLYECSLISDLIPNNKNLSPTDAGFLAWHDECPNNLVTIQDMYRQYI